MKEVVPITTQLFELSKETAKLEATNFELRQKVALAAEVKAVLDSWVRFEQAQKAAEQEQLVKSVVDKVTKSLSDEKVQKDILAGAVAEIERKSCVVHNKASALTFCCRDGEEQGHISNYLIDYLTPVIEV
jgi:F-type H+-transporting ATPase subunit b